MLHGCLFLFLISGTLANLDLLSTVADVVADVSPLVNLNILTALSNLTTHPLQSILTNNKDFLQIATEYGYNPEQHEVTTEDGYILALFRIPPASQCIKKTPMLLMHGVFLSAECFADSGPNAPAFLLAQDCHDVWVGNSRGTFHSRRHVSLNPDKDFEFWQHSQDELGKYDLPALVDYVLDVTGAKKLNYVGYSQGGVIFFIMNSEKPEYSNKINLFVGLAPGSRVYYTKSLLFRALVTTFATLRNTLEAIGVWEVFARGQPLQATLNILCQAKVIAAAVCNLDLAVLDNYNPGSVTPETVSRLHEHFPAGTSVRTLARYGQSLRSLKFVKFDFGDEENLKRYGVSEPPEYDLGATKMPAVIFHGKADNVVDARDLDWVVSQLPNVLEYIVVEDPKWDHVDTVYSQYWEQNIFAKMKTYLDQYESLNST